MWLARGHTACKWQGGETRSTGFQILFPARGAVAAVPGVGFVLPEGKCLWTELLEESQSQSLSWLRGQWEAESQESGSLGAQIDRVCRVPSLSVFGAWACEEQDCFLAHSMLRTVGSASPGGFESYLQNPVCIDDPGGVHFWETLGTPAHP